MDLAIPTNTVRELNFKLALVWAHGASVIRLL